MIAAMMLPSSLPLVRLFARGVGSASRARGPAMAAFLGGYALVWSAFGALAFMRRPRRSTRLVDSVPLAASARPWLIAGGALALAGAFQFSSLKDACLKQCRHPGAYLMHSLRARRRRRHSGSAAATASTASAAAGP